MNTATGWAVTNGDGTILINTVRSDRSAAIRAFLADDTTFTWETWRRKYGVRLIPVTITEKPA